MNEMKAWQFGYDIDYLKGLEQEWAVYNQYTASPFAKYRKDHIAKDLSEGNLILGSGFRYVKHVSKVDTAINLYGDVVGAWKRRGDVSITKLILTSATAEAACTPFIGANTWVYAWAEDLNTRYQLEKANFEYITSKVTTFGELYAIYFRDSVISDTNLFDDTKREHVKHDTIEFVTLKKIGNVYKKTIKDIAFILEHLNLEYTNHYSNYNKNKSWKALSLRGYYPDWTRIEKPDEMNKQWKEKHKDDVTFLQDTQLYSHFPMVYELIQRVFGNVEIHRVRFMWLAPNEGELQRHTDQVDPDCGLQEGKITRFHFPIQTNPDVKFQSWDLHGNLIDVNMKENEFWLLDTRKPHRVVNGGHTPRIHLVVDIKINKETKDLILKVN